MATARRILIADDHPETRSICRRALEAAGFVVSEAATLADASRLLAEMRPWMLLLDAALSGGDVNAFADGLARGGSDVPRLILLVPPRLSVEQLGALRTRADASLFKPVAIADLTDCVEQLGRRAVYDEESTGDEGAARLSETADDLLDSLRPGAKIGGCRLDRLLGQGATGVVFLGRHLTLDVPVAVKVVPVPAGRDDDIQRFLRGARAVARIEHPNVVAVLNAGREGAFQFLVQRYVEGVTLKRTIASRGRLEARLVVRLLKDLAGGLGAVHRAGVVHRDVKPANIVVTPAGVAMLTDFGLARQAGAGDISNGSEVVGTAY